jgi:hypothetical protein
MDLILVDTRAQGVDHSCRVGLVGRLRSPPGVAVGALPPRCSVQRPGPLVASLPAWSTSPSLAAKRSPDPGVVIDNQDSLHR